MTLIKLKRHGRYDYSPIVERPVFDWPGGKRLAFAICNNIEVFSFRDGLGSDSASVTAPQTSRNYAWRDYGNRVGQWYLFDLLDEYGLPASHNFNSLLFEECPQIADRIMQRGDEFIGHGRTNAERQDSLNEAEERELIREATAAICPLRRQGRYRLARPLSRANAGHARSAEGGRLSLRVGLAGRRPAILDAHARRADTLGAVLDRGEQLACQWSSASRAPSILSR